MLDDIGEAGISTFASQVRRALAEDNRRVHAHLAGLRDIDFAGAAGDPGYEQWQASERASEVRRPCGCGTACRQSGGQLTVDCDFPWNVRAALQP